jgi:hypothetical protein
VRVSRRLAIAIQLAAILWTAFLPQFAIAYDHPLSDEAVRDAYFIGQDVKNVNHFLSQYTRSLPLPASGPDVAEIALSTPYAQVVEVSAQHSVGYSAGQAAEDYRKRGDFIAVRVKVLFTPTYPNPGDDFWRSVSVRLIQKTHIAATRVSGEPIYVADAYGTVSANGNVSIGANIYARFSVASVKSDSVQVEVALAAGAPVHATLDLRSLR